MWRQEITTIVKQLSILSATMSHKNIKLKDAKLVILLQTLDDKFF